MSSTPITIDICVPLYINHPSLYPIVTEFFASIKENYPDFGLIVVDDSSPLAHGFPVTYRNEKNLGYVKTTNKCLELSTAPIVIVLNDDLIINQGDLDRFKDLKGLIIASCQDTAGTNDNMFGSNFGMTRETYKLLGGLDERFTNYFADRKYYELALKKGVEIIKWHDIVLPHIESATFKNENKDKLFTEDQKKLSVV